MILKAMAEKGSSSSACRVMVSPFLGLMPFDRRDVERRRQVVDHSVQKHLHALVLERGAAEHRGEVDVEGGLADGGLEPLLRDLFALEVVHHQLVVTLGEHLDHVSALGFGPVAHVFGHGHLLPLDAHVVVVEVGDHADEVDDAAELVFAADGELQDERPRVQPVDHHLDAAHEVGARCGPSC